MVTRARQNAEGFVVWGPCPTRPCSVAFARENAGVVTKDIVMELFSVLEAYLAPALSNAIAADFLGVLGVATMRAVLYSGVARRLLSESVTRQCPEKRLSITTVDGSGPLEDAVVQIDIGVIREQIPVAAASVISSAVALVLAQR